MRNLTIHQEIQLQYSSMQINEIIDASCYNYPGKHIKMAN